MTLAESPLPAVLSDPSDDTARLVFADWLDENGGDGRLWRELTYAFRKTCRTAPRNQPAPPSDWKAGVEKISVEYRSWFAAGCAVRCALWVPKEFQEETLNDVRDLLTDLTIPAFSDETKSRANTASSRAYAAYSRASAARSRESAAYSRANAAYARASAAHARAYAASSRAYATYSRAYAANSRANAANSRAYAAYSRANAAERRWQAGWLWAVHLVVAG